jgi:hypothetical protein
MLRWWVENEMFKFPMRRWPEPWRMLLVMLAVLLPAAALIAVNHYR